MPLARRRSGRRFIRQMVPAGFAVVVGVLCVGVFSGTEISTAGMSSGRLGGGLERRFFHLRLLGATERGLGRGGGVLGLGGGNTWTARNRLADGGLGGAGEGTTGRQK